MQNYFIYFMGQNINTVKAASEASALKKHFKQYKVGEYVTVARAESSTMEQFKEAMQQSLMMRN